MNFIKVTSICVSGGVLRVAFDVSVELEQYFSELRVFEIEYSEDVSAVPESVLVIPFVCDVLPIVWLTDATLEIPQLDKEFYESIPKIRQGYVEMSPMLDFKGAMAVGEIIDNHYEPAEETAAFFSGGVDAFATLVAHANENPKLITLWGADVKLDDVAGWNRVKQHVIETSLDFELPVPLFARSNFRTIVNEGALNDLVQLSGEAWWYGFQHGIAIIGHAAPFSYLNHWKQVYIASTNTIKDKVICASDPTIDNEVRLVTGGVWHDQYECTRQQKVQHIVEFCRQTGKHIRLRVCWQSTGGSNCGHCEKCVRTIYNLLAEGACPTDYGFNFWEAYAQGHSGMVRHVIHEVLHLRLFWSDIQNRFRETQAWRTDKRINWIYSLDVNNPLTFVVKVKTILWRRVPLVMRGLHYMKRKLLSQD